MDENNLASQVPGPEQSAQIPQVAPQDPSPSRPKSKLPLIIIGVIIFLLIGGATAFASFTFLKPQATSKVPAPTPTLPIISPPPSLPIVTSSPSITPPPDSSTLNWKTVKTTFAEFKIPLEWHFWKCTENHYVIADWGAQTSETEGCPFDGTQVVVMYLSDTAYNTVEEAIPKTESTTTQSITISEIKKKLIDGKNAAQWKTTTAANPGQEELQGAGTFLNIFITPNIFITADSTGAPKLESILSTFNLTN